jgi:lipoprotein-anchoring transpeptidase ErfK/SrfK
MKSPAICRRQFLKTSWLYLSSLALAPLLDPKFPDDPDGLPLPPLTGRITRNAIWVYREPDPASEKLKKLTRDEIVDLQEIIYIRNGPSHNPRWYKLDQGYVHSAYIQRVDHWKLNTPTEFIPPGGILGKVTVPYTQSFYRNRQDVLVQLYRLYYDTVHWIIGAEETNTGELFYRLKDEWLQIETTVLAKHLQIITPDELAPQSTDTPDNEKMIQVSLKDQALTAFENEREVYHCQVSTGKKYMETPTGTFKIDRKYPSKHMGDGGITSDPKAYELIGVPWVSFFHEAGIAFHGTFWHDNFGTPMSQGCVNLRNEDALWIFRWTNPYYQILDMEKPLWRVISRFGTAVIVN